LAGVRIKIKEQKSKCKNAEFAFGDVNREVNRVRKLVYNGFINARKMRKNCKKLQENARKCKKVRVFAGKW